MSILDSEPLDIEEPSDTDKGGVSPPLAELDVHVLERERDAGPGLEKMDCERTALELVSACRKTFDKK